MSSFYFFAAGLLIGAVGGYTVCCILTISKWANESQSLEIDYNSIHMKEEKDED